MHIFSLFLFVKQSNNFTRIGIIFLNITVKTLNCSMVLSYPPNLAFNLCFMFIVDRIFNRKMTLFFIKIINILIMPNYHYFWVVSIYKIFYSQIFSIKLIIPNTEKQDARNLLVIPLDKTFWKYKNSGFFSS